MAEKKNNKRRQAASKYDAQMEVLAQAYGALADLRRELSESKTVLEDRQRILREFANCIDPQKAWLLLEDYFERLSLSRRDFPETDWWQQMVALRGDARIEQLAFLFMRAGRTIPPELVPFANKEKFAQARAVEHEQQYIQELEKWLLPPLPTHLEQPRARLIILCQPKPDEKKPYLWTLQLEFHVERPRLGLKQKTLAELLELTTRNTHEIELFPPEDITFLQWLAENYKPGPNLRATITLYGLELLIWLAKWGSIPRLKAIDSDAYYTFLGQTIQFLPNFEQDGKHTLFVPSFRLPNGKSIEPTQLRLFNTEPGLALVGHDFYLVPNVPPPAILEFWKTRTAIPLRKLGHRLLLHLHKTCPETLREKLQLCVVHRAKPRFVFELHDDVIRLQLFAVSEINGSLWIWTGHEWQRHPEHTCSVDQPEILDDPRLEPATQWLKRLDWFTPEPGLWISDANEHFLASLATVWDDRPRDAEYLANPEFTRLFIDPIILRPQITVRGSGIDWLSVCAEWQQECLKLTPADLQRLATAKSKFVKLPDAGWVMLDQDTLIQAHEMMAELGVDGLVPIPQKIPLANVAHFDEEKLQKFADSPQGRAVREYLKKFKATPSYQVPPSVKAQLRPYQKDGFNFLCHLSELKLGGILADDMGLGKTVQTLAWLAWLKEKNKGATRPSLVICPASVLQNWRREAERFVPSLKVLLLQSGSARHALRKLIPEHDIIVTNYALLRRDLEELQRFQYLAIVLDEAQYIKNPDAQITQAVKELKSEYRLALTGTPLENRLLDLWSIIDFVQPGYLGSRDHFLQTYDPHGENAEIEQRIARKKLAAKVRPLILRRLKSQVAKDLPERIEQRLDCELTDEQRKVYLAELRHSREEVFKSIREKGLNKARMQVLAALTRLRQICCHPRLVGSDVPSGKTETLFELVDQLLAEGQKVLVFSQFVQMLEIIRAECNQRNIKTYIITGQTKERLEVVNAFQADPDPCVFLLSLRAAGTGLNLTAASYVILYDPWWNPAVEAQAIDRTHRIGQTQTVNAYRLIAPNTVEDKIWELQQRKAQTISDVLGEEAFAKNLTKQDLEYLFSED